MGKINILDTETANKIAAGEIIERPLSVVKELLENSLDAKANFIEIEIKEGGLSLIRVTDNGSGMVKEDALIAFERHATSKINSARDLFNIKTFGFRGEALPSIGTVSQILLITKDQLSPIGTKVSLIGGKLEKIEEIAFSPGTSIEVRNLFFNTPARRKFLKSLSFEAGLITELVTKYSLGHPEVRFKLINSGEVIYDTATLVTIKDRLGSIYGENIADRFIHLPRIEFMSHFFVEAWLSQSGINRNTRTQQTFFINGRMVKSLELSKVLDEAYHTMIPKGRFPLSVINLTLPNQELDVNIHPAKLQIKINNLDKILNKLIDLFKTRLWNTNNITPKTNTSIETLKVSKKEDKLLIGLNELKKEKEKAPRLVKEIEPHYSKVMQEEFSSLVEEAKIDQPKIEKEKFIHFKEDKIQTDRVKVKKITDLEPMAQLNNSFILAQNKQGLYIIDQHTCHERILYEKFMKEEETKEVISENLLIPLSLKLSGKQEGSLLKSIIILKNCGFILENFGPQTYILRSVPTGLTNIDMETFFIDLLEQLVKYANISPATIKETILTMAACKGAIKANQKLTKEEMVYLLQELDKVDNAHTCPHGRPIFHHLSMQELYKIFQRGQYQS